MECSPIIKSGLINSPTYELMGKVIFPGFVIVNTHFMKERERQSFGSHGVSTLTVEVPASAIRSLLLPRILQGQRMFQWGYLLSPS